MTQGGEGPGLGGYPELAKPTTRVTSAWRSMWTQLLVRTPTQAHRAHQALAGVRSITRKRRR